MPAAEQPHPVMARARADPRAERSLPQQSEDQREATRSGMGVATFVLKRTRRAAVRTRGVPPLRHAERSRAMSTIEKSIDINVPVHTAYNQWTQFEEFPHFMDGVREVKQLDDKHLHWCTN